MHPLAANGKFRLRLKFCVNIALHILKPSGNHRLSRLAPRYRFLWRLRAPLSPGEIRRIERWLASARVFLAISALFAIWMDPSEIGYSPWAYWALGVYIVHGVVVMMLLRFRQQSTAAFRLLVHAADVIWPVFISAFAAGQRGPFFLFFVFVLMAAAYRWGLWETLGTAATEIVLLWAESLAINRGVAQWAEGFFLRHGIPPLGLDISDLGPKHLMLSVYLLVTGLLLGYLAEQQKQLRAEKEVIARILGGARVDAGLTGTLQRILGELLSMYGARRALIASQEANSYRVFLGEVRASKENPSLLNWQEVPPADRDIYLYKYPADACYAVHKRDSFDVLGLDREGMRLRNLSADFVNRLARVYDFHSVVTVALYPETSGGAGSSFLIPYWREMSRKNYDFCWN